MITKVDDHSLELSELSLDRVVGRAFMERREGLVEAPEVGGGGAV